MGSFLEKFAQWLADGIGSMLDIIVEVFNNIFAPDMSTFNTVFPLAKTLFDVLMAIGIAFVILNLSLQLLRIMMGLISDNSESILKLVLRSMLVIVVIINAGLIMDFVISLAKEPYNLLVSTKADIDFTKVSAAIKAAASGGGGGGGGAGGSWGAEVAAVSPIKSEILVTIILMCMIGYNYIKLLFEMTERYLMLAVMYYLSPLAFATAGSESTNAIFKSWCKMLGSQLILMLINVWFLRIASNGLTTIASSNVDTKVGTFFSLVLIVGILKIGQRMDNYMSALGVNTAQTGAGLGSSVLGAGYALKSVIGGISNGVFGRGGVSGRIGDALTGVNKGSAWAGNNAAGRKGSTYGGGVETVGKMLTNGRQNKGNPSKKDLKGLMNEVASTGLKGLDNKKANTAIAAAIPGWGAAGKGKIGAANSQLGGKLAGKSPLLNGGNPMAGAEFTGVKLGNGNIMGRATLANGKSTGFVASTEKPAGGYHQQIQMSDGQGGTVPGYAKFDNPAALKDMAAFGPKSAPIGNSQAQNYIAGTTNSLGNLSPKNSANFAQYNSAETQKLAASYPGVDASLYKSAYIGKSNGLTYLEKQDGTLDLVRPISSTSSYTGQGHSFTGLDGNPYSLESGTQNGHTPTIDDRGVAYDDYAYKPINYDSSYMHLQGESSDALVNTLSGISSEDYCGVHIGQDGTTLLERANQTGFDELIPAVAVDGKLDNMKTAIDAEGMVYVVEPHSGTAFDYLGDALEKREDGGTDLYYTDNDAMLARVAESYNFGEGITVDAVEFHRDANDRFDYMGVVLKDSADVNGGGLVRLMDTAQFEPASQTGDARMLQGKNGTPDVYIHHANKNLEFAGNLYKPRRIATYKNDL